jgi:enamine deaminase RidA (YjgF/YER057c/UK114 family)
MATVRIETKVHQVLKALAEEAGESMQSILATAIESERRRRFLKGVNRAYAKLSEQEQEELSREHAIWDVALQDGLPEEQW